MLGVIVNSVAILIGSFIGLACRKAIPKKIADAVMIGVGLCVVFIAVGGLIPQVNVEAVSLAAIVSIVVGAIIGTAANLDGGLNKIGDKVGEKMKSKSGTAATVAEGFVNSSLLFCVGAMAIMGSISAGLEGNNTTLYIKSILDFTSSIMFASTFGVGVVFSIIPLTIYQGAIALGARFIAPLLDQGATDAITCTGSIILVGLALNLIGVTKIKVANYLPAIFISPFLYYLFNYILGCVG